MTENAIHCLFYFVTHHMLPTASLAMRRSKRKTKNLGQEAFREPVFAHNSLGKCEP